MYAGKPLRKVSIINLIEHNLLLLNIIDMITKGLQFHLMLCLRYMKKTPQKCIDQYSREHN